MEPRPGRGAAMKAVAVDKFDMVMLALHDEALAEHPDAAAIRADREAGLDWQVTADEDLGLIVLAAVPLGWPFHGFTARPRHCRLPAGACQEPAPEGIRG